MSFDPRAYLKALPALHDEDIDLAMGALALAMLVQPGLNPGRYISHLEKLSKDVTVRYDALLEASARDDIRTRLAALKHVMADQNGYAGDFGPDHNMENANIVRAIDRRRGLPVTLAILYIQAARAQGWEISALQMPGYFLCRLEKDGERLIFDPADSCRIMEAFNLRGLVKKTLGERAELSASYFEAVADRDILIALQNHVKFRQIEMEDYEGAVETVAAMRLVAPAEYRLLLDEGVLLARINRPENAMESLISYIEKAPPGRDRQEAAMLLEQLRKTFL